MIVIMARMIIIFFFSILYSSAVINVTVTNSNTRGGFALKTKKRKVVEVAFSPQQLTAMVFLFRWVLGWFGAASGGVPEGSKGATRVCCGCHLGEFNQPKMIWIVFFPFRGHQVKPQRPKPLLTLQNNPRSQSIPGPSKPC